MPFLLSLGCCICKPLTWHLSSCFIADGVYRSSAGHCHSHMCSLCTPTYTWADQLAPPTIQPGSHSATPLQQVAQDCAASEWASLDPRTVASVAGLMREELPREAHDTRAAQLREAQISAVELSETSSVQRSLASTRSLPTSSKRSRTRTRSGKAAPGIKVGVGGEGGCLTGYVYVWMGQRRAGRPDVRMCENGATWPDV